MPANFRGFLQEGDDPMGLPFDWHLRPRRITHLRTNTAQRTSEAGSLVMGRLSSLRPSMAGIRESLRRFSIRPVSSRGVNLMLLVMHARVHSMPEVSVCCQPLLTVIHSKPKIKAKAHLM